MNEVWSILYNIAGGGVIAGIALFLSNILYRQYVRPQLSIEAGEISEDKDLLIRVMVKNEGKTAAQNCAAKISIDHVSPDDLLRTRDPVDITPTHFRPIKELSLPWANTSLGYITINAHDNEVLKVFRDAQYEDEPNICLYGVMGDFEKRCALKSEGKEYNGKISITAKNAKGTEIDFIMKVVDDKINLKLEKNRNIPAPIINSFKSHT